MNIHIDVSVEKFIYTLKKATIAKILRTINLLEQFEHQLGLPHSKNITNSLFELRIRGQQEIRIFYVFKNNKIILFYALKKKTQKIPKHEMKLIIEKLNALT